MQILKCLGKIGEGKSKKVKVKVNNQEIIVTFAILYARKPCWFVWETV